MRALTALTVTGAITAALAGCAADPEPTPAAESRSESTSPTPTESPSDSPKEQPTPTESPASGPELAVSISGDKVLPNAEVISVDTDEPLVVVFTSDRPGELHVHSKPEQILEFPAGKSEQELVIGTPGLVEIEEHESGAVVAQLKVGG